ncbi:peptidase [Streptomyces sp. NPDC048057]|uniref:peptidase n=1 Tax=Streptomyces sp. NPDC048057 TaxID=3155628 RepID=UPI0034069DC6
MTYQKRTALALAAATAAVTAATPVLLLTAPAAHAAVVDVNYQCQTPIGPKGAVSPVDIKAVKSGSGYDVTMSFEKGVSSSPIELGKGAMNPSAKIKLGGADSGEVAVVGKPNDAAVPANTPIKIGKLTGKYAPKKNGKVTFTAGVLTIKALGTTTTCTPSNKPGPSLELDVTGAAGSGGTGGSGGSGSDSGGTTGGNGTGGTTGGSSADGAAELPKTGPLDSAVALATLGGTVVLTGAAGVLWLTRRGARRTAG